MGSYLQESSMWYKQVQACLKPASFIAKTLSVDAASVLVHCSDGVDITSIVVSLAKLLMDPYYRTLNGLRELLDEDWTSPGFRYIDKLGGNITPPTSVLAQKTTTEVLSDAAMVTLSSLKGALDYQSITSAQTQSAIIALFFDCVHQVWQQFPQEFEFSLEFLCCIFDHTIACQFGNFMRTGPADAEKISESSYDFWSFISHPNRLQLFRNDMYEPVFQTVHPGTEIVVPPLPVSSHSRILKFWRGFFDCFDPNQPYGRWNDIKWQPTFVGTLTQPADINFPFSRLSLISEMAAENRRVIDEKIKKVVQMKQDLDVSKSICDSLSTATQ